MQEITIRLPGALHAAVERMSARAGIPVDRFVAAAVAEKVAALMTEDDLRTRAGRGSRAAYEAVLASAPDVEADEADRA